MAANINELEASSPSLRLAKKEFSQRPGISSEVQRIIQQNEAELEAEKNPDDILDNELIMQQHPLLQDDAEIPGFKGSEEEKGSVLNQINNQWQTINSNISEVGHAKWYDDVITARKQLRKDVKEGAGPEAGAAALGVAADLAIGTVTDFAEDIGNSAIVVGNAAEEFIKLTGLTDEDVFNLKDDLSLDFAQKIWPDIGGEKERIVREIGGFILPFGIFSKLAKGTKVVKLAKGVAFGAGLEFIKQDPDEENFGAMIGRIGGFDNIVFQYMAAPSGSKLEAKLKGAMSAVVVDLATLGTGVGIGKMGVPLPVKP